MGNPRCSGGDETAKDHCFCYDEGKPCCYCGAQLPMTDTELLEAEGWTVECESPLEIRHFDGSYATGQAVEMVLTILRRE